METFELFAEPWWVNLIFLTPFLACWFWKKSLNLGSLRLLVAGIFGAAFGFVESSVVVYLRGSIGLLSERETYLPSSMISFDLYRQSHLLNELPRYLLTIEMYREFSTIIMIAAVALLAHSRWPERLALFFWIFALWDIFYYVGLKFSIGWPKGFSDADVLFLLPVPWLSQVWFPILVSLIFLFAIFFSRQRYS